MDRNKLKPTIASITALILVGAVLSPFARSQSPGSMSAAVSINNIRNAAYCADTSVSANTITCTTGVGFTGYNVGQAVDLLLANTITGASTININGLGAVAVTYNGATATSLGTNMLAGATYRLIYDGTRFTVSGVITFVPAAGGSWAGVTGCIPFRSTQDYTMSCDSGMVRTPGVVNLNSSAGGNYQVNNTSGTTTTGGFELQLSGLRAWIFSMGLPGNTDQSFAFAEYTAGVFQRVMLYIKKGGTVCLGSANTGCTTATLTIKDATATTGATRVLTQLGAADTVDTVTETNAGGTSAARFATATNCSSSASPAVCSTAAAGSMVVATGATTVVVNTTAVTANSQITVIPDTSLGTKLGVTCNTLATLANFLPIVTARTAATSFTVTITGPVAVNPACYSYTIVN